MPVAKDQQPQRPSKAGPSKAVRFRAAVITLQALPERDNGHQRPLTAVARAHFP
ncbi:hypothetical protein SIO70_26385 [Chitinophaga sancti]|uniref:hypothetical protein n=1 Tax=Chitinophaga sancti TaxID=1004 RepID=UPI002A7514C4|nr:hypothetical protein [Chitinophaga sancti]WPQ61894.1 hypothetical protein SIO70_26385 [Chitinophaga sancti]